ncbi:hypothetical protein Pelo_11033 [Pelomyxa schiedti]|nr:hypothetical protein Pelo_11033 [Pelomyxa schiedti]
MAGRRLWIERPECPSLPEKWRPIFTVAGLDDTTLAYDRPLVLRALQQLVSCRLLDSPENQEKLLSASATITAVSANEEDVDHLPDPALLDSRKPWKACVTAFLAGKHPRTSVHSPLRNLSFGTLIEIVKFTEPPPYSLIIGKLRSMRRYSGVRAKPNSTSFIDKLSSWISPSFPISSKSPHLTISDAFVTYISNSGPPVGSFQVMPKLHIPYFEVTMISLGWKGAVGVGLALENYIHTNQPGWVKNSFGHQGDDGSVFANGKVVASLPTWEDGDVVGCGVSATGMIYWTMNGKEIFRLQSNLSPQSLWPTVGLQSQGESVLVSLAHFQYTP